VFSQVNLKLHSAWKGFFLLLLPCIAVGAFTLLNGAPVLYLLFGAIGLSNLHFAAHAALIPKGSELYLKDDQLILRSVSKTGATNDAAYYFSFSNWFGPHIALLRLAGQDKKHRLLLLCPWTCDNLEAVRRLKVHYIHNSSLHFNTAKH